MIMADLPSISAQIQELEGSYSYWNNWALAFTAGAAICAILAATCAVGYFFTSYRANKQSRVLNAALRQESLLLEAQRQDEKKQLELRVAEQQGRAAAAEQDLLRFKERLLTPRDFNLTEARETLKGKPTGSARIICIPESEEALNLGRKLAELLRSTGWTVSGPEVKRALLIRSGLVIEVGGKSVESHLSALREVLLKSLNIGEIKANSNLDIGTLVITIGALM
jgi:hypothetical protein